MGGQFHAPAALSSWKEVHYASKRTLSGPCSRSERYGEKEKLIASTGNRSAVERCLQLVSLGNYTDRAVRVRKLVVRDTECGSEYSYGMSAAFASVVKI